MKKLFIIIIVVILFLLFFLSFLSPILFSYRTSKPPGCKRAPSWNGIEPLTGCSSRQSMVILANFNPVDCLSIREQNCSTPSLEITNNCSSVVYVKGERVSGKYMYVKLKQGLNLVRGTANNSSFVTIVSVSPPLCM